MRAPSSTPEPTPPTVRRHAVRGPTTGRATQAPTAGVTFHALPPAGAAAPGETAWAALPSEVTAPRPLPRVRHQGVLRVRGPVQTIGGVHRCWACFRAARMAARPRALARPDGAAPIVRRSPGARFNSAERSADGWEFVASRLIEPGTGPFFQLFWSPSTQGRCSAHLLGD